MYGLGRLSSSYHQLLLYKRVHCARYAGPVYAVQPEPDSYKWGRYPIPFRRVQTKEDICIQRGRIKTKSSTICMELIACLVGPAILCLYGRYIHILYHQLHIVFCQMRFETSHLWLNRYEALYHWTTRLGIHAKNLILKHNVFKIVAWCCWTHYHVTSADILVYRNCSIFVLLDTYKLFGPRLVICLWFQCYNLKRRSHKYNKSGWYGNFHRKNLVKGSSAFQ